MAAALVALHGGGGVTGVAAVGIMASASFVAAVWTGLSLAVVPTVRGQRELARQAAASHWTYGRWAVIAAVASWIPWNLHLLILSAARSLEEVAEMRALYNVLLPVFHFMMAVSTITLPALAGQAASSRPGEVRMTMLRLVLLYVAATSTYFVGVLFFGERVLSLVYGNGYASVYWLAPWVAAVQIPVGGIMVVALAQRAAARTDRALLTWLPYVVFSLALGGVGGARWGVTGVVFGILAASVIALGFALCAFRRWTHGCPKTPISPGSGAALP
jgi:O-antigen/teichoic acid export membrane protein